MTSAMRRALWVFLATGFLGLTVALVAAYQVWTYPERPAGAARGPVDMTVPKGAGAGQVADLLMQARLIDKPSWFRLYASQRGAASRFRAGHYKFEAPLSPRQLIDSMVKGVADELVSVTIPEGKHMIEIAELFDAAGITKKKAFVAQATNAAFARSLDLPGTTVEGYLYPDTYRMRPNTPAAQAIVTLVRRHRQVYEELRALYASGLLDLNKTLGWDDPQIVTLASIVEKETGQAGERPRIAQVFLNRLRFPTFQPKKLETDPTIIYGCAVAPLFVAKPSPACANWAGNIKRIHLNDAANEYNTYQHEGLPPAPISNPGRASLAAVMKPDGSPYLFFVAKGLNGTHHFSATMAEHQAAVVRYQLGGRSQLKTNN